MSISKAIKAFIKARDAKLEAEIVVPALKTAATGIETSEKRLEEQRVGIATQTTKTEKFETAGVLGIMAAGLVLVLLFARR